ncbi:hypothetical protein DPMN_036651 [Dreissena polymorpha]|uniref:Uncharacterized protein n=1 Tax=Dreissena polymorpha TaxID=45954 RepID=A0A9D4MDY0_DREPO|nr:hypothetical protein DPMN_036651 [Dreissena polymorpha]
MRTSKVSSVTPQSLNNCCASTTSHESMQQQSARASVTLTVTPYRGFLMTSCRSWTLGILLKRFALFMPLKEGI